MDTDRIPTPSAPIGHLCLSVVPNPRFRACVCTQLTSASVCIPPPTRGGGMDRVVPEMCAYRSAFAGATSSDVASPTTPCLARMVGRICQHAGGADFSFAPRLCENQTENRQAA